MDTLPLDQELEVTLEEWRRASAEYRSSLRSPSESRVTDPELYRVSMQRKLGRVLGLERDIRELRERIEREAA